MARPYTGIVKTSVSCYLDAFLVNEARIRGLSCSTVLENALRALLDKPLELNVSEGLNVKVDELNAQMMGLQDSLLALKAERDSLINDLKNQPVLLNESSFNELKQSFYSVAQAKDWLLTESQLRTWAGLFLARTGNKVSVTDLVAWCNEWRGVAHV